MSGFSPGRMKAAIAALTLAAAAVLLLWRLDAYSLWDDEVYNVMNAKSIVRCGDMRGVVDGNLVAVHNGILINDRLQDRATSPAAPALTALFFAAFGEGLFVARLPFALCGLAALAWMLWWARGSAASRFALLALAMLGNVSFFLYCRNSRYYALLVLCVVAIAWFYWHWAGRRRDLLWMALFSIVLCGAHFLAYAAVYMALLVDYLGWHRRRARLGWRDWLVLVAPQIIGCGLVTWLWNPLRTRFRDQMATNDFGDKAELFWWHLRDLDRCGFWTLALMVAALAWGLLKRREWLVRGAVATLVALVVTVAFTPQSRDATSVADVRYVLYLIPLALAMESQVLHEVFAKRTWLALVAAVALFFTNWARVGAWLAGEGTRSLPVEFAGELRHPPAEPYAAVAEWVNNNVRAGGTVHVAPGYMAMPLIFHAPHALYAWQLDDVAADPRAALLPPVHFKNGGVMPDYLIGFGPHVAQLQNDLRRHGTGGTRYVLCGKVDVFWAPLFRPEIFWRTFKPVTGYNQDRDAVFVFKRVSP